MGRLPGEAGLPPAENFNPVAMNENPSMSRATDELPSARVSTAEDIEAGNEIFGDLFDYEQTQLTRGEFRIEHGSIEANGSILSRFDYRSPIFNQGALLQAYDIIALPPHRSQDTWWGRTFGDGPDLELPTLVPGETLVQRCEGEAPTFAVFIPHARLERESEVQGQSESFAKSLGAHRAGRWLRCRPESARRLQRGCETFLAAGLGGALRASAREVEDWVVASVLELIEDGRSAERTSSQKAAAVVRDASMLVDEAHEIPSVSGLALQMKVPRRSLCRAFSEVTGSGPQRFLMLQRLNRVFRELKSADPKEVTVTDVAVQHGFTELGRFAGLYRQVFSELPSETLRAAR